MVLGGAPQHPERALPMMFCRTCSYDLKSLVTSTCPECGRAFDPNNPRSFDTRPRAKRLMIRIAASVAISVLSFGTMVAGVWIASGLKFGSFETTVLTHVSLGAACALITAIAAACIPSWIARAILLLGGVLSMWVTFILGIDQGYRVWQSQPDAPDEAYADGGASIGAIFVGWMPSGVWWLASFVVALLVVRALRRRSNARRVAQSAAR